MRGRPDVDVKLPTVAHPGDTVPIVVVLESHSETPIDFVDLLWNGEEAVTLANNNEQIFKSREIVAETIRLRDKGTLQEGKHRFEAKVRVPSDAPGSYLGVCVHVRYEVRIHVAIPWWPDLRESFDLFVEPRPEPRPKPAPATRASQRKGESPVIEVSLADTAFAAGDEVSGAFAVGDAPARDGLGVEVSLASIEVLHAEGYTRRGEQFRYMVPAVFRVPKTGVEVPFRFRVPKDVTPSFKSPWCELVWTVQASLRTSWGEAVGVAVNVTIGRYATAHDPTSDRPRIGAQKWRKLWSETGERHGLSLARDRLALEGQRGEVQIEVAREDGDEGPALVTTLRYPSLGIGLTTNKQIFIVLPSDLDARLPGYKVGCREAAQGLAFLTQLLCDALQEYKEIRVSDTSLVALTPGGGLDAPGLESALKRAGALAAALVEAIAAVPPPAAMAQALPAWKEFALSTGAHLSVGGMALTAANVDGAAFDIQTLFDGDGGVVGTRLSLEMDPPLSFEIRMGDLASFSAAPPGCRELAVALQGTVKELAVSSSSLAATLAGAVDEPADLRPKLAELLTLSRRLHGERSLGPYR